MLEVLAGGGTVNAAITLRPYQLAAVEAVLARFRAGDQRTLLVLATGLGKTVCFTEIVRRGVTAGRRVLVLAHRSELLEQAAKKLASCGVVAQIEQGERRAVDAPCIVASVQTLRGARLERWPADAFDLIVIDEAHHAVAKGYGAILARFESARVLGVTATPDRLDGARLGELFDSCAYRYELRAAIRDGWLAPIRARRIAVDGVDLDAVHTRAGDLDRRELARVMEQERALHGVAVPLLEQADSRRSIVFSVDVAHANALAEVINRYAPGAARALDGGASANDRAAALAAFRAGEFRVLVNCALFTEGFDEPSISCVAIARPTKSRALYTQMVGRGTRMAEGKADCLVLDFSGMAGRHRLVGPADVLAGRELPDDVRQLAERALDRDGEQLVLDAVLDAAEAEATSIRERLAVTAVARYRADVIDPFVGELPDAPDGAWTRDLATDKQREALERAGLDDLPASLTKGEANRWLDAIAARRAQGLATVKQVRLLRRYGIDARALTLEDANAAIGRISERGWRRSA